MPHENPNIDKSHDWYLPEGMLNRRCRKCGAYAHLGSGFCPCPLATKPICRIMRGLPGSGKSRVATEAILDATICSADDYQMDDGVYNFKPERAKEAHLKCYLKFLEAINSKHPYVIVDNTNTDPVEIAPYYRHAEAFGYDVIICVMNTPLEVCLQRQTHNVPLSTMVNMALNLTKPLPRYWKWEERKWTPSESK